MQDRKIIFYIMMFSLSRHLNNNVTDRGIVQGRCAADIGERIAVLQIGPRQCFVACRSKGATLAEEFCLES